MPNDNNNNIATTNNMHEPTLSDIFNILQNCSTKDDINNIKLNIAKAISDTDEKIENVNHRIDRMKVIANKQNDKMETLEINIEVIKQEHLKNNICISGVPPNKVEADSNTADLVIAIAKALNVELTQHQFSAYTVAQNKFIVVHFFNFKHKQMILNKIRIKRSLLVEEVFGDRSNSQIYLNDHLTPYFNKLYLKARKAKQEGKLASASSYGGKIRARISINDAPTLILCERHLNDLIDAVELDESSNKSVSQVSSYIENNNSTNNISLESTQPSTSYTRTYKRPYKRSTSTQKEDTKLNTQTNSVSANSNTDNESENHSRLQPGANKRSVRTYTHKRKADNQSENKRAKKPKDTNALQT